VLELHTTPETLAARESAAIRWFSASRSTGWRFRRRKIRLSIWLAARFPDAPASNRVPQRFSHCDRSIPREVVFLVVYRAVPPGRFAKSSPAPIAVLGVDDFCERLRQSRAARLGNSPALS